MIPDPLAFLKMLEAKRRAAMAEPPDVRQIEAFVTILARAIVNPERVENPACDYRPYSVRDALLCRVSRMYGSAMFSLRFDLTRAVSMIQQEQAELARADEIDSLEHMFRIEPPSDKQ